MHHIVLRVTRIYPKVHSRQLQLVDDAIADLGGKIISVYWFIHILISLLGYASETLPKLWPSVECQRG